MCDPLQTEENNLSVELMLLFSLCNCLLEWKFIIKVGELLFFFFFSEVFLEICRWWEKPSS